MKLNQNNHIAAAGFLIHPDFAGLHQRGNLDTRDLEGFLAMLVDL